MKKDTGNMSPLAKEIQRMTLNLFQAWSDLEQAILDMPESELRKRLVLHITEVDGWNEARNISGIKKSIFFITHAIGWQGVGEEKQVVTMRLEKVKEALDLMIGHIIKG